MLGGYISDLAKGDVFKPVDYVITPFMCREYAHGCEESSDVAARCQSTFAPESATTFFHFAMSAAWRAVKSSRRCFPGYRQG